MIPRAHLEHVIRKLVEDRYQRQQELTRLRAETSELRLLLRSALWQMAQQNGSKNPRVFVSHWLRDRRKREP